jgi:crotonobetainyl-CoA:carnitine CoA-transferase CaiB-like acyl-CoA transferase
MLAWLGRRALNLARRARESGRRAGLRHTAKTRDEWCKIMEGSEICFTPVLNMDEAP